LKYLIFFIFLWYEIGIDPTTNPISMKYLFFLSLSFLFCVEMKASPVVSHVPVTTAPAITPAPADYASMANDVLTYVNAYRRKKGLSPLVMNAEICAEAQKHSEDMAMRRCAFGHDGWKGRWKKISAELNGVSEFAENVALGSTTAREVVDNWLKSAMHKENIEGHYKLTGIGIVADKKGVLYFTQIFATQ
jgi:uncharacterized protein YkwD